MRPRYPRGRLLSAIDDGKSRRPTRLGTRRSGIMVSTSQVMTMPVSCRPVALVALVFLLIPIRLTHAATSPRPNVLLIMSDDLRDYGGVFTREVAKTPNLQRLAARGIRFDRAYAQYPVCNPSRVSLLTGRRCEETGIVGNQEFFRSRHPEIITFPQRLRQLGWTTRSFGKILHAANTGETVRPEWLDQGRSWDHAEILPAASPHRQGEFRNLTDGTLAWCEIGILDGNDDDQPDARTAAAAIRSIEELSAAGKPWLIAAGFHRPHDPFHAPRRFFDGYPRESLRTYADPPGQSAPAPLAIPKGWIEPFARFTENDRIDFLRAYLAGVSFMDAQVGRLLDVLDRLGLWSNTLVIFIGDHGYHLGERGWWNKNTLYERSCRVPMILAAPGTTGGQVCRSPVELVDLYPTITEFCQVPTPPDLAGRGLAPVLRDVKHPHKGAAFTLVTRGDQRFGQSVTDGRWRLMQWSDGAVELYDHETDPEETRNLSGAAESAGPRSALQRRLAALPPWPPRPSP